MAAGDVITIVENSVSRKGVYFDGTDDYILIDAHTVERVAANDVVGTYAAWIYSDNLTSGSQQTICSAGTNASTNECIHFLVYSGLLKISARDGGADKFAVTQTTANIPARTWTHVAVVQNGTQPALYVNGVNVAATNTLATDLTVWFNVQDTMDKFAIGVLEYNGTHSADFQGAIGQLRYWSRVLTAAEIAKIYNCESVSTLEFPDSTYLRLNVTMGDNGTTDSGAGADNGTLTGNAHYGGYISTHSIALEANTSGHAAERSISTDISPSKTKTIIVRGD